MQENNDDLKKKPYLKDAIDLAQFHSGQANVIIAPCNSGKTTAAKQIISKHAPTPGRALYLIDTTAGRDALLATPDMRRCTNDWICEVDPAWWTKDPDNPKCVVMTYHRFGHIVRENPTFVQGLDLIVCDEMHNLIRYIGIEMSQISSGSIAPTARCCRDAFSAIVQAAKQSHGPLVVIMTATPNPVSVALDKWQTPVACFDYTSRVRSDTTRERIFYGDYAPVLQNLKERALIYVPTIRLAHAFQSILDDGTRRICILWSVHNEKQSMDDKQYEVRESILKRHRIPEWVDVLIINAAYETSINIKNEDFRTMIIHTSNPDIQIQVRGRLRHDIDKLYLHSPDRQIISPLFPTDCLDRLLSPTEVGKIAERMDLHSKDGRPLKWASIYPRLRSEGMIISKLKKHGRHYWVVHNDDENEEVDYE